MTSAAPRENLDHPVFAAIGVDRELSIEDARKLVEIADGKFDSSNTWVELDSKRASMEISRRLSDLDQDSKDAFVRCAMLMQHQKLPMPAEFVRLFEILQAIRGSAVSHAASEPRGRPPACNGSDNIGTHAAESSEVALGAIATNELLAEKSIFVTSFFAIDTCAEYLGEIDSKISTILRGALPHIVFSKVANPSKSKSEKTEISSRVMILFDRAFEGGHVQQDFNRTATAKALTAAVLSVGSEFRAMSPENRKQLFLDNLDTVRTSIQRYLKKRGLV